METEAKKYYKVLVEEEFFLDNCRWTTIGEEIILAEKDLSKYGAFVEHIHSFECDA